MEYEAFMRHELKNSLTPIKGYSEILTKMLHDGLSEKQLSFTKKISEAVSKTVNLTDSLQKLHDFEMGNLNVSMIEYDLKYIIDSVVFDAQMLAEDCKVSIQYNIHTENTFCMADIDLLPGVFQNLIKNAIEHVSGLEQDNVVKVDVSEEDGMLLVRINNKGEAISPERLSLFFEKFNTDRSKKSGGTGLGTTYAYLITNAHQGEISVKSDHVNGTTVTLKFRLTQ